MNAIDLLKVMVVAGSLAVTSSAWSQQSSDSMANPSASTTTDAKTMHKADRKLAHDVRRAMAKAQGFDVSNVFVKARSGVVTLSGTVPTGEQIGQAGQIAQGVAGVSSVNNRVTLAAPSGGGN